MPVITYMEALRQALRDALTSDERVFVIGEDVVHYDSAYGVTKGFVKEFGDKRIRDMPIAEAGYAGLGIGAAMNGLRPIGAGLMIAGGVMILRIEDSGWLGWAVAFAIVGLMTWRPAAHPMLLMAIGAALFVAVRSITG